MPFGRQHVPKKDKTMSGGVSDIGTGLQAVAAAITDPDTISAYQTETRDGSMSNRTFYGGVHEMAGGVHDAAGGINELGMSLHHVGRAFEDVAKSFDALADSIIEMKGAIQPLSRSINHIAAAATAVGLTFLFGATGPWALVVGITILVGSLMLFHFLLGMPGANRAEFRRDR